MRRGHGLLRDQDGVYPFQALAAAQFQFRTLLTDRRDRRLPGAPL